MTLILSILSYTTAAQETDDWVLGLIEMGTGKQIQFTGKTAGTDKTFAGAGDVVGNVKRTGFVSGGGALTFGNAGGV